MEKSVIKYVKCEGTDAVDISDSPVEDLSSSDSSPVSSPENGGSEAGLFTSDSKNITKPFLRNVPPVNTPEKIVFCIDASDDPGCTQFKLNDGSTFRPLAMVRRALDMFMTTKCQMNKKHEFALIMLLADRAVWIRNFTKTIRDITSEIDSFEEVVPDEKFDLTTVFDVLKNNIDLPTPSETSPEYSIRVILIYNRSHCIPKFMNGRNSFDYFVNSHYFTFDLLYIHENPTEDNKCEEIYDALCDLDVKGWSYIFEVQKNAAKLHNEFAKLLAHPFQRPPLDNASHNLAGMIKSMKGVSVK